MDVSNFDTPLTHVYIKLKWPCRRMAITETHTAVPNESMPSIDSVHQTSSPPMMEVS